MGRTSDTEVLEAALSFHQAFIQAHEDFITPFPSSSASTGAKKPMETIDSLYGDASDILVTLIDFVHE